MNFEELIDTLSKGSATAVTTLESNVAELNALKEYRLYRSKNGTGSHRPGSDATNPNRRQGACPVWHEQRELPTMLP